MSSTFIPLPYNQVPFLLAQDAAEATEEADFPILQIPQYTFLFLRLCYLVREGSFNGDTIAWAQFSLD